MKGIAFLPFRAFASVALVSAASTTTTPALSAAPVTSLPTPQARAQPAAAHYLLKCFGYGPTAVVFQNAGPTVPAGVSVTYRVSDPPHSGAYIFVQPLQHDATLKIDPARRMSPSSSLHSGMVTDPGVGQGAAVGLATLKPCAVTSVRNP